MHPNVSYGLYEAEKNNEHPGDRITIQKDLDFLEKWSKTNLVNLIWDNALCLDKEPVVLVSAEVGSGRELRSLSHPAATSLPLSVPLLHFLPHISGLLHWWGSYYQ